MAFYSFCSVGVKSEILPCSYLPFLIRADESLKKADITIEKRRTLHFAKKTIKVCDLSYMAIGKCELSDNSYRWLYEAKNGMCSFSIDPEYTNVEYCYLEKIDYFENIKVEELFTPYFQIVFECKLLQRGVSVLHAACIELNGYAYAFTGPSGIGKSTRAQKWCDLLSAQFISGDRPAINIKEGTAYGVPWDGKEAIYRNVSYPLAAIIKVRRSEKTCIIELTETEKLQLLYEQSFLPLWDTSLVANSLFFLKHLINTIPIFELCCDITDESTYISYKLVTDKINNMKGDSYEN